MCPIQIISNHFNTIDDRYDARHLVGALRMLLYGTLHVLYIQYTSSCYWSIILRYRITLSNLGGSAEVSRWEERSGKREVSLSFFLSH